MTAAGIHLRAQGFIRDGSPAWFIDLRVDEIPAFRAEVARLRGEQAKQYDAAVEALTDRLEREWVKQQFKKDQTGPATPLSEVLP